MSADHKYTPGSVLLEVNKEYEVLKGKSQQGYQAQPSPAQVMIDILRHDFPEKEHLRTFMHSLKGAQISQDTAQEVLQKTDYVVHSILSQYENPYKTVVSKQKLPKVHEEYVPNAHDGKTMEQLLRITLSAGKSALEKFWELKLNTTRESGSQIRDTWQSQDRLYGVVIAELDGITKRKSSRERRDSTGSSTSFTILEELPSDGLVTPGSSLPGRLRAGSDVSLHTMPPSGDMPSSRKGSAGNGFAASVTGSRGSGAAVSVAYTSLASNGSNVQGMVDVPLGGGAAGPKTALLAAQRAGGQRKSSDADAEPQGWRARFAASLASLCCKC
jgi:hypothetical protein